MTRLLHDLRSRDAAAAQALWDAYFGRMVGVASGYMRSRHVSLDAESAAGSAMATFVCRARDGHFPDLGDRECLWGLLLVLTIRKVIKRMRRMRRRAEVNFSDLGDMAPEDLEAVLGSVPDPAVVDAIWGELIEGLDERRRRVARLRLEGFRNNEISRELSISEATVERDLRKIREAWMASENVA
ncbi:ECF-type sigma factor [Aquisphaera giovannonii]|uniref:ECF-type sigma factor n=1 Tax=Aquisphaera giovannonii TaxID=406548 RepID=UPI00143DD404|nr:ECF-type sigma factor [Aquisphaera giovannonii]